MPLLVQETSWWQTPSKVFIKVSLNNVPTSKVDVFTSEKYIKLHYDRYIFEKLLLHPIDEEASTIRLANNEAEFELVKLDEELWDQLEVKVSKKEATDLRIQLMNTHIEKLKLQTEEMKRKKDKRLKDAVSVQMKLESQEQANVSQLKERQKWEALAGNSETNNVNGETQNVNETIGAMRLQDPQETIQCNDGLKQQKGSKLSRKEMVEKITREVRQRIQAEERQKQIPFIRSRGQINVTFTPRVFPTPTRESMAPEEEEWLKKQAAARQACGFAADDLRPEENNIAWVAAKAQEMYGQGNYLGAVSAYTHGLSLCPELASVYMGRSEAHFKLNNLHKAVDDASEAIKLLTPPCESNRKDRLQAHLLRGRALVGLKVPKVGLLDFEHAVSLTPLDDALKHEVKRVRELAELPEDSEGEADFSSPPLVITQ